MKFEHHITIENNESSVISSLSQCCELSNAQLKQAIAKGALWHSRGKSTQRLRRIKKALLKNDTLHFYYNEQVLNQTSLPAILLADHQEYSIWYKPYGMLSQGSKWSDHLTIGRFVQQYFSAERSVFVVHRLDKAATGIMVVAHSKSAARLMSNLFEQHHLEKYYQIIVHGDHRTHPQPEVVTQAIDEKAAKSSFTCLDYDLENDISLVKVLIETGRKHQIRKHAAFIGLPVVGDRLHGDNNKEYKDNLNLQLCAVSLKFECPITGRLRTFQLDEALRPNFHSIIKFL